ncbi:MAG TPA: creatininase family protein [Myxococcaceae bacterium]|nr:creatininase family protein [Myxococcaceae bacterium]
MGEGSHQGEWPRAALLSWPEMEELAGSGAVALVPVGSTEAHGPHLPLNVDVVIAEEVCRRVSERLSGRGVRSVTFPAVPYGITEFAASFSGTISVQGEVVSRYLEDVLAGVASHGFRRIGVVNHHLEPAHFRAVHRAAGEAAARTGARVIVPDHRRPPFVEQLGPELGHGGSHAGVYETSLVLAIAPELVREEVRRRLPPLEVDLPGRIKAGAKTFLEAGGPQAYFGDPAVASAEEGERLLELLAEFSAAAILADSG